VVGWRGWREVRSVTPLAPVRYARFIEAAAGPVRWTGFGMPANRSALGDLAAVGTVIVPRTAETNLEGDPELVRVADINGVSIFRNRAALPRARVVHTTVVARTTDDAVARLASGTQGAAHVSTTPLADSVILEGVADAPPPRELHGGRATPATFIADDPDDVILQVDAPQEGYLVLADTHYPGWRATVDGHPRAIYPANVGFRAVHVETGRHQVAFHFRPASFRAGMACALLGLLACGAISIAAALRARRRPASPTY
ncbi:MAG: YfhO family protein, partial [Pseudomonadota bacterium]